MPIVMIEMLEGRTPEQKDGLYRDVADAIARNANCSTGDVRIIIREMSDENYSVAGLSTSEIRRRAQAKKLEEQK